MGPAPVDLTSSWICTHAWVIAAIPTVASMVILFAGKRLPLRGGEVGIASMIVSLALSLWAGFTCNIAAGGVISERRWFDLGRVEIEVGTIVDGLGAVMLVVLSIVSLLVQIYSTNYMKDDRRYTHFFAVLTLFTAAMSWFVMSSNTLQMVLGWELMGLCSYLLIGHWWEEKTNTKAAIKALLTIRASDIGLVVGVIVMFFAARQTFDVTNLNFLASTNGISHAALMVGSVALLVAVIGKSAQFPLHTWLPDAMAGPTPISALIHAATMVVAGVYLLVRLFPVFASAFSIGPFAQSFDAVNPIAVIGAITIVSSALLAFVQDDIKKVLSYSTISQIGYMVMAVGVGAWSAAMFHLFTHAFFKALLFLAAGSVSHVVHGFDLREDMGGLRKVMPLTHASFAVGALSLVGVIPLSGFWSKSEIVGQAGHNGYMVFQIVAIVGTLLTAGYMYRCYHLTFLGRHRGSSHPHESPRAITIPCVILAILSVVAGLVEVPVLDIHIFSDWMTRPDIPTETVSNAVSFAFVLEIVAGVAGLAVSALVLFKGIDFEVVARRSRVARVIRKVLVNGYYLDWLYSRVVVDGMRRGLARTVDWVDRRVVDNVVIDTAMSTEEAGALLSRVQNGRVQRYVIVMLGAVAVAALALVAGY